MLRVYTLEQGEQWDAIVRTFQEYDIYWLSGYAKAFQIHGDGEPILLFYDDDVTRGINVVMKRDIAKDIHFAGKIEEGHWFDCATPYGYGGWLIEGNHMEDLFCSYHSWLEKNGIISEFVRFHPLVRNHEACRVFYEIVRLGEVVHMDLSSPEVIKNNLTRENRNRIRKAVKNNIVVHHGNYPDIYEKFRIIYNGTMKRDNAAPYYYFGQEFYKSVMDELAENSQVFWAEKDGRVIAAFIITYANGRMNYFLSGSLAEFNSQAPGNLIMYTAALWGCENGCQTFLLGGGVGSNDDNLLRFKKTFYEGELNHYYVGKKIVDREKYSYLLSLRKTSESSFFPQYRA